MDEPPKSATDLRRAFAAQAPWTVGVEEEVMLLDPRDGSLVPGVDDALALLGGDARFKRELPASQLEIVLPPTRRVRETVAELRQARRELAEALNGRYAPAAAAVHPTASPRGEVNRGERYEALLREYGEVARRQLVCALQIHVAPGAADRALAIHNALRSYLPEIAALAANGPLHDGADTGLASVRPKIAEALPRQGVPPALESFEQYAAALGWAGRDGLPGTWWWEVRMHPSLGTLELRVPDAQSSVDDAAGVVAFVQALVRRLGELYEEGNRLPVHETWRIEENRWSANRHGLDGEMIDLDTGERRPTRDRLRELVAELAPVAERLGCERELELAGELAAENGAIRQRSAAEVEGIERVPLWLAARFTQGLES